MTVDKSARIYALTSFTRELYSQLPLCSRSISMWKSRQGLCAAAIREQQSLRKRDAFLAAALEVAAEQRQPQLVAEQATRSDAVAAMHILRRKTKEARQQLSSRLDERRLKLCLLFEDERGEENAALRRMQHSVGLKEQDIMSRAAALRRLRDEERKKQDDRMRAVKWQREHEHSLLQTSKLRLKEVVAANEAQIASKIRRQQKEKEAAAVFEALWTEDLNGKRLRERRIVTGKLKKLEQTKEALLDQIAKREETRQQEIQRLRAENELEIRRLHEESESAARQRQLEQGEKAKKRREMGNALAQQLTERHQLRLKDAALEQEQLEAQAKLGLKAKNRTQLMKTMEVANANHLMHQDKQKQMQELKEIEAQYTREQAAAEDCKTREYGEAERDRKAKEREVDAYRKEQMMEREARKAAEKAAKAEELKQATAATLQHRADLRREIVERHESMKAYRQALDAQSAWSQSQLLKCQER